MKRTFFFLSALLTVSAQAGAGTVIYTDTEHLPDPLPRDIPIVLPDSPD